MQPYWPPLQILDTCVSFTYDNFKSPVVATTKKVLKMLFKFKALYLFHDPISLIFSRTPIYSKPVNLVRKGPLFDLSGHINEANSQNNLSGPRMLHTQQFQNIYYHLQTSQTSSVIITKVAIFYTECLKHQTIQLMQKPLGALVPKVKRKKKKSLCCFESRNKKYTEKIVGDQYSIWTPRLDQTIDIG